MGTYFGEGSLTYLTYYIYRKYYLNSLCWEKTDLIWPDSPLDDELIGGGGGGGDVETEETKQREIKRIITYRFLSFIIERE